MHPPLLGPGAFKHSISLPGGHVPAVCPSCPTSKRYPVFTLDSVMSFCITCILRRFHHSEQINPGQQHPLGHPADLTTELEESRKFSLNSVCYLKLHLLQLPLTYVLVQNSSWRSLRDFSAQLILMIMLLTVPLDSASLQSQDPKYYNQWHLRFSSIPSAFASPSTIVFSL